MISIDFFFSHFPSPHNIFHYNGTIKFCDLRTSGQLIGLSNKQIRSVSDDFYLIYYI